MENYRFILIDICHYRFLPHLDDSESDFWRLHYFLRNLLKLSEKQALFLTDRSKLGQGRVIYPNRNNLLKVLNRVAHIVFFQGYAAQSDGQNYLLPIDADLQNLEDTALNLRSLLENFQPQSHFPGLLILDLISIQRGNPVSSEFLLQARQKGINLILHFNRFQENQGELAEALADAFHYYQNSLNLDILEFYLRDRLDYYDENPLIILSSSINAREQPLLPTEATISSFPTNIQRKNPAIICIKQVQSLRKFTLRRINFSFPALLRSQKLGLIWLFALLILLGMAIFSFRSLLKLEPSKPKNTDQIILEEAKIHLKRHQASDFIRAIQELRRITPDSQLYPEAQKRITFWSQTILEIAQGRAEVGNWQDAIAAASLVPADQNVLYNTAQKSIDNWRESIIKSGYKF